MHEEGMPSGKTLAAGDVYTTHVNHGERVTTVLAVFHPEALVEIEMPGGTTMLRTVPSDPDLHKAPGRYKNQNYHKLTKRWLVLMAKDDTRWIANPQGKKVTQTPWQMFMERWPDEEWRLEK